MGDERPVTERTGQLLRENKLKLKKSLGQNFLTDATVLDKMIAAADVDRETVALEIGAGIGALTERLAEVTGKVIAVEIDDRLIPILQHTFAPQSHVQIVQGDILTIDIPQLLKKHGQPFKRSVVIANLPYYITSAIIMRLLELDGSFYCFVFMLQKEVSERILAQPGNKNYGILSIAVQYYAIPERVARVPAHVFIPRPKVESVVIRLTPHARPPVDVIDRDRFFSIVKASFKERRKTIANNLQAHLFVHWDKTRVNEWLMNLEIDPIRRAETLSLAEFARLSNALCGQGIS